MKPTRLARLRLSNLRLGLIAVAVAAMSAAMPAVAQEDCENAPTPVGAHPPAKPIWCLPAGADGPPTFVKTRLGWVDDFDHGLTNAPLGPGYRTFPLGATTLHQHFRHADHWMQDVSMVERGGTTMRPERAFRFVGGRLAVEATVAAGIAGYGADIWPEITVTTASQPTEPRRDALYAYDAFSGHYTLGCRLHADRYVICALFDDSPASAGNDARLWEMSFFQHVGTHVEGGGPWGGGETAWRVCENTDPDMNCRDNFRLELTATSLVLYVNGFRYFAQEGIPRLPAQLLQGRLYAYLSGVVQAARPGVARFHWDRVAVNPPAAAVPPADPARHVH